MGATEQKRSNAWDMRPTWLLLAMALVLAVLAGLQPASAFAADAANADAEASDVALSLVSQDEGYSAVLYDNTNGLPTSEANAIAETSEGFIWIGSYSGLIRYDGNTFERMDSTTGITSVVSLFVDSSDRLWIGTNDSGVAVMERGELRVFNKEDGLASLSIRAITQGPDGLVYAATTEGLVMIDADMNVTRLEDERLSDAYVRDVQTGADGLIYGLTMDGAVFTLENGVLRGYYGEDQLGIEGIMSVLPDPENPGRVYLGTEKSEVLHGNLEQGFADSESIDVAPLTYIKRIEIFDGVLWLCTDNGIGYVQETGAVKLEGVPLTYSIDHMMMDYSGNLWFTSSRQGVMKIVPNQFSDIFDRFDLDATVVNSTCQLGDRLFIGCDSGLTVIAVDGVVKSIPLTRAVTASGTDLDATDLVELLNGCRIRSIMRDSDGRLWFATFSDKGLVRYADGEVVCFTAADGLPSDRVRAAYEGADGTIMVACTGGLALIDGNQVTKTYGEEDGLVNSEILTVVEAQNGDIVLGSDGGGIYVLRDGKVTTIGTDAGLHSDVIMRVKKDTARDVFWIVTSNSIAYMDADYNVTTVQKFPYSNNFDIYENTQGQMWVLSSNGIYVVPVEDMLANGEINPVFFGRDDGLPCIATANSYSALTEAGDLYIAGTTGVAKVNIEKPFESVESVKMAVPYVEVDGRAVYPNADGSFTIPADARKLTVYGYVYTYSLMNPQVTYHLDGFDQGATTVSRSEFVPIDYTNLGGGTYNFVMKLQDSLGRGSNDYSVTIVKSEAIYEKLWFRILVIALIALVVWLGVRFYIRRKTRIYEQKAEEQRTFIREMTEAFAKTIDMKDTYTNGHSTRVAEYTALLARELGYSEEDVDKYYRIALLHDIGKIGVPDAVLNKPDRLTEEEYEDLKSHTTRGYDVLKDISIMPELAIGAGAHHERPDGKGYPKGLKGDEIPRVAQIIAVADAFDAMYSTRTYRSRMNFERVVGIIKEVSGTQLASDVVDAFMRLVDKGYFRAPDDTGGGTMEEVDNIEKVTDGE